MSKCNHHGSLKKRYQPTSAKPWASNRLLRNVFDSKISSVHRSRGKSKSVLHFWLPRYLGSREWEKEIYRRVQTKYLLSLFVCLLTIMSCFSDVIGLCIVMRVLAKSNNVFLFAYGSYLFGKVSDELMARWWFCGHRLRGKSLDRWSQFGQGIGVRSLFKRAGAFAWHPPWATYKSSTPISWTFMSILHVLYHSLLSHG